MTITYFEAYLLTRLDAIGNAGVVIMFLGFFLGLGCFMHSQATRFQVNKILIYFVALPIFIIGGVIKVLTPTTKQMAFIYIAPAIVNNKDIQETFKQMPELTNLGLEYLKETLKEKINDKHDK